MDRDGNLPGLIRISDDAGSRLGQDNATLKPLGGFEFTLTAAEVFQACAARACEVGTAAKG